jgi:hypothetical protein
MLAAGALGAWHASDHPRSGAGDQFSLVAFANVRKTDVLGARRHAARPAANYLPWWATQYSSASCWRSIKGGRLSSVVL